MSFMAKPTPVDKPPDTTTSHELFTWNMERLINSHIPHIITCMTFFDIAVRLIYVVGSILWKWYSSHSIAVWLRYLNKKYSVNTWDMPNILSEKLAVLRSEERRVGKECR